MLRFVLALTLATAALAAGVPLIPCGGNIGSGYFPRAVRTEHCTDELCRVSLTAPIDFSIDAVSPSDTPYINVYGNMYYKLPDNLEAVVPVPFPDEIMSGCNTLTSGSCPLSNGEQFTSRVLWNWVNEPFMSEMEVGTTFEMEFRIYDISELLATCFRVPVEFVA